MIEWLTTFSWVVIAVMAVAVAMTQMPEDGQEQVPVSNQWACHEWLFSDWSQRTVSKAKIEATCDRFEQQRGVYCDAEFTDENATIHVINDTVEDGFAAETTTCVYNGSEQTVDDACDGEIGVNTEYRFTNCAEYVRTQRRGEFVHDEGGGD